jgi:4-amino-4-deoxy-L-arabinose transferase-like glycosyltransferase
VSGVNSKPPRSEYIVPLLSIMNLHNKFWLILAYVTISISLIAGFFWLIDHTYGMDWDEALYINQAYKDFFSFKERGFYGLAKSIIVLDRSRPPAHRILVLPFTLIFGVNPVNLRLVSLISLGISIIFIYLSTKRIAGSVAGCLSAMFLATCPVIISNSMRFGTEYPLYLSISLTFYFLVLILNSKQPRTDELYRNWIGLALAFALGGLAKTSFIFIVAPILLLVFSFLDWLDVNVKPRLICIFKALLGAIVILSPWWIYNFSSAFKYALYAGRFVRHSLGPKNSLGTWLNFLDLFNLSIFGTPLTILILAIVLHFLIQLNLKRIRLNSIHKITLLMCIVSIFPILILSALGANQNPRLISPILLPLAIIFGVVTIASRWTSRKWLVAITIGLFSFQLAVMVTPLLQKNSVSNNLIRPTLATVMGRREQWDWSKLREICNQHQIPNPSISYLGNAYTFNPPQISYPWVSVNETVKVNWLWRYEQEIIDWKKIMKSVNSSDVILTAPALIGDLGDKQDLDNQHNIEFIQRMQENPRFAKPIELEMGRFNSIRVLVFLRK